MSRYTDYMQSMKDKLGYERETIKSVYIPTAEEKAQINKQNMGLGGAGNALSGGILGTGALFGQIKNEKENKRYNYLANLDTDSERWWVMSAEDAIREMEDLEYDLDFSMGLYSAEDQERMKARYAGLQSLYGDNSKAAREAWKTRSADLDEAVEFQKGLRQNERIQGWHSKYAGMSYYDLNKAIGKVADPAEKAWLQQYAPTQMTEQDYSIALGDINTELYNLEKLAESLADDPLNQEAGRLQELGLESAADVNNRIEELKRQKWQLEHDQEYRSIPQNEDFELMSQFTNSGVGADFRGVNQKQDARDVIAGILGVFPALYNTQYERMTEEEVKTFNYLYQTQGKDAAEEYIDYLKPQLDSRRTDEFTQSLADFTGRNAGTAFLGNAASVPLNLLSGIGALDVGSQHLMQDITGEYRPINYNNPGMMLSKGTKAIRGTTADMITDATGTIQLDEKKHPVLSTILNGRGLADVYQLGMSAVDSRVAALTGDPVTATILLASSAATSGMLDALERGATDEQALQMGMWNGAFEALFEFIEVDSLLKGDPNWIKAVTNQAVKEGLGEGATSIANNIADGIIMADKSELMRAAAEYEAQGLSEREAYRKAFADMMVDIGWDIIGGAASGGLSAGGYSAVGAITSKMQYNALPQQIKTSTERLESLGLDRDAALDASGKLFELGKKYEGQRDAFMAAYDPKQDVYRYASDFNTAWEIGRNNGNREYIGKMSLSESQGTIAYELGVAAAKAKIDAATTTDEAVDTSYSVSEEGNTVVTDTGETISIKGFSSVGKDAVLDIGNGKTIKAENVSYADIDEAMLYETVAEVAGSTKNANNILDDYRKAAKGGMSASDYAAALRQTYDLGVSGQVAERQLGNYELAGKLGVGVRSIIFSQGRKRGDYKATAKQSVTQARGRQAKGNRQGTFHFERNGRTFSKTREASLGALERLSKALGVDIYIYESYEDGGKRVYQDRNGEVKSAPNGWYDTETGAIHIDLNAGNFGQGTMMFTAAHELTHFIKDWSPVKFRKLADLLIDRYAEQGVSVRDLIDNQIAKAEKNGRTIDRDTAFEEVVADSMETMLTQGDAASFMAELKQQDKTLWEKVRDWFKNLAEKLRGVVDAYQGYTPDSPEGRLVAQMEDFIGVLQEAYSEALMDASENYRANEGKKNTTREGGDKYQTRNVNGKQVVWIQDNVLKQNTGIPEHQFVANYIAGHIGDIYTIIESGQKVYIGEDLPGEFTQSKYTQSILKNRSNIIRVKNRSAGNIGEMIEIATNRRWEKAKHPENKDAKYGMYRYDTMFGFPVLDSKGNEVGANIYKAELVIRNASDGKKYLYDIVSIKKDATASGWLTNKIASAAAVAAGQKGNASVNKVSQQKPGVKTESTEKRSDREYLAAVERGDMATAQRMVDKAAKKAGYPVKAWHGTPNKGITVFDSRKIGSTTDEGLFGRGFYFSTNKATADGYAKNAGETIPVFLNVDKAWWAVAHRNVKEVADMLGMDESALTLRSYGGRGKIVSPVMSQTGQFTRHLQELGYDSVVVVHNSNDYEIVVFDAERIKSAAPVTYDDAGNVILLSERFDTTKSDIRYSDRDPTAAATAQELEKQGKALEADVENLMEMLRLQGDVTRKDSSILSAARYLSTYHGVIGSKQDPALNKELAGLLMDFYSYLDTEKDLSWEQISEKAKPVAEWIFKHTEAGRQRSEYARNVLAEIRSKSIRLTEAERAQAAEGYDSYEAFRKSAMGSLTLANQGSSLDAALQEWSRLYPGAFDAVMEADNKPQALMDTIRGLRTADTSAIEYAYIRDMTQMELARSVYDSFWRMNTVESVRSKNDRAIEELRRKHRAQMITLQQEQDRAVDTIRRERKASLDQIRNEYRSEIDKAVEATKEKYRERQEKTTESRNRSAIRNKIRAFKKRMEDRLLHPTDSKYVPEQLARAIIEVCELIDTDTDLYKADGTINKAQERRNLAKEKLGDLKDAYEKLSKDKELGYSEEYDQQIDTYLGELKEKYAGKQLSDMTTGDLNEFYSILSSIEATLRDAKKLIGWADAQTVYAAGDAILAEQGAITKSRKNGSRNAAQKTRDWRLFKTLSPMRNVERMSAYHQDSYLLGIFKKLEDGVRRKNKFVMDSYKSFETLASGKEYDRALYDEYGGRKYTDVNGRKFGVSKMQMMQCILSLERETANNMKHIDKGGFTFANLALLRKGNVKEAISEEHAYRVANATALAAEFREALKGDKWCQDYMEASRKFFNETAKNAINETMLSLKHRIIARDKNYIPFEVDKNFVSREISAENDIQQTINSYGMLKETTQSAPQPLIVTGLNNVIDRHIDRVGNVYGLAVPVRNFNKVWNARSNTGERADPTVKAAIQRNWGNDGVKHIEQAVQDIQGPRIKNQSELYQKVKSGYIGATFALNLSVVGKQIGSMYSATSMLRWRDPVRMTANLLHTMVMHKKISAEVDKYTATAWMRRQGMSDAELHTLLTQAQKPGLLRLADKLPAIFNPAKWITAMDHAVALSLWKYAKQDTAKRTGLKGEALLVETAKFYDDLIESTQSMSDMLHRPEIQKSGNWESELFGTFKTDLYQMAGQLQNAAGRFSAKKSKENAQALARTVYGVTRSILWTQLISILFAMIRYKVNPYRDEEDKDITMESFMKRMGFQLTGEFMGYLFPMFGGEAADIAEAIAYGEKPDAFDIIALSAVNDLVDVMSTVAGNIKDGEMPSAEDMKKVAVKALQLLGVPANNIVRTIDAIKLHAEDIANGEFLSFEAGANRSTTNHVYRIVDELDSGNSKTARAYFDQAVEEIARDKAKGGEYGTDEVKEAKSQLKSTLGKLYKDGLVARSIAEDMLRDYWELGDEDIYWTFDKWDYAMENGTSDGYQKNGKVYAAALAGEDISGIMAELVEHGKEEKDVLSELKSEIGVWYTDEESDIRITRDQAEEMLQRYFTLNDEEIETQLLSWDMKLDIGFGYNDIKQMYLDERITSQEAVEILVQYRGFAREDAALQVEVYDWKKQGYDKATTDMVRDYNEYCQAYDVPKDVYLDIRIFAANTENDVDEEGNRIKYSAVKKIMAHINSYPISKAQKDAIAHCIGWSEKTIRQYKLW